MKKTKQLVIFIFVFCLLILPILLHINDFIFLSGSEYSDIAITHFPNLLFIQKSILMDHQIPLWSGLIYSGYPFAANPLSGLAYIWGWFAVLFPLPAGINITVILHLMVGFLGMFFFLKQEKRSEFASIFGAIAFAFSIKIFAHLGAGHLTMLYAVIWSPWLLFLSKLVLQSHNGWKKFLPGVVIGFIITADIRWIIPVGILWVIFLSQQSIKMQSKIYFGLQTTLIGVLTSAGLWLSFIQFLNLSTRSQLTQADQFIYSLKLQNLLGLFFPDANHFAEIVLYPSAIVLLLVILGIFIYKENKSMRFWYLIALGALLLAFGDSIPGLGYFFNLPGLSLLRVPSRFLWLMYFAFAVIASFVFDWLVIVIRNYKFDRLFFLIPIVTFISLLMIAISISSGEWRIKPILGITFFIFGTIWIGLSIHNKIAKIPMQLGLLFLLITDLSYFNFSNIQFVSNKEILFSTPELIQRISDLPNYGRIYTPSYSISQAEGAYWDIQQINGIDPMQLIDYVNFFKKVTSVEFPAYSVTLPAFSTGDPQVDNQFACPKVNQLQSLNVGYIISEFTLEQCQGMPEEELINGKHVYPLSGKLVIATIDSQPSGISLLTYQPNRIELEADRGGLLVLREIYYPGWVAYVDGIQTPLEKTEIFRAIRLNPGQHEVKLIFQPILVFVGFGVQISTWIILLIIAFFEEKHERRTR